MNNDITPAKSAKRTAVAKRIKQIQTPLIVTTAAIGACVLVQRQKEMLTVLAWHQQRISELVECSNQLLEDVRTLQQ